MRTGRPRRPIEIAETEAELYERYRKEKDVSKRQRYQFAYELKRGNSIDGAARVCGISDSTASVWVNWLRQGGLSELVDRHAWGGQRRVGGRLSEEQEAALAQEAAAGRLRTIQDGVVWARTRCQVHYTYWGMRWVFARLGLKKKTPRPAQIKRDEARQRAWREGAQFPVGAGGGEARWGDRDGR